MFFFGLSAKGATFQVSDMVTRYSDPKKYSLHYDSTAGICLPFGGTTLLNLSTHEYLLLIPKTSQVSYLLLLAKGRIIVEWVGCSTLISHIFKYYIDECHKILILSAFTVVPLITASLMTDDSGETGTEGYQCAVFSTEFALARLWMFLGIQLVAVVGGDIILASDLQFFERFTDALKTQR